MTELENEVRGQLQRIAADVDLRARGFTAAARAIEASRRRRRQTRQGLLVTAGVVAASVAVVGASSLGLLDRQSDHGSAQQGGPSVSDPATAAPSSSSLSTATPPPHPDRSGPSDPAVGVGYPFDLYTHCGIREATFAGRQWQASPPAAEPRRLPDANGITDYGGYVSGTMTLLPGDRLRFTINDPLSSGNGQSFLFLPRPATAQPLPPCA